MRIGRLRTLARYGLAKETEPGTWTLSDRLEPTMQALGERGGIVIDGLDGRVHHVTLLDKEIGRQVRV